MESGVSGMTPATPIALDLTLADADVILTMLTKAPVPGEYWLATFAKIKAQCDALIAAPSEPRIQDNPA